MERNGSSEMKPYIRELGFYGSRIFEVWTNVSAVETSVYLNSSSNRCFFISLDRRNSWILLSPEIKNRRLREIISGCEVREDRRNSHDDSRDGIESIATIESTHAKGGELVGHQLIRECDIMLDIEVVFLSQPVQTDVQGNQDAGRNDPADHGKGLESKVDDLFDYRANEVGTVPSYTGCHQSPSELPDARVRITADEGQNFSHLPTTKSQHRQTRPGNRRSRRRPESRQ